MKINIGDGPEIPPTSETNNHGEKGSRVFFFGCESQSNCFEFVRATSTDLQLDKQKTIMPGWP